MTRALRPLGPWLLLLAASAGAACGSKSGLSLGAEPGAGGAASGSGGSGGSGATQSGGSSAGGGGGIVDAGPDAPPPLPDCVYVQHGDPIVIFTYAEGVHTPSLAPIAAAAPGTPARIAVGLIHEHFWHPEIRVAELSVGPAWPDGVSVTHGMLLYGIDAHAPGQLVPATGGGPELALLYYHADEASPNVIPGVKFRRFDTAAWKPFDEVFIEQLGGYAYSIAPGPALGKGMGWAGLGYGITWRSATSGDAGNTLVSARAAVTDTAGNVMAGPVEVAPASSYPGIGATIAWNGQSYLVASNAKACAGSSPECANQLTVARLDPGVGPAAKLAPGSMVPPVPGLRARTPLVRSYAGATWVAWREQPVESKPGDDPASTLRLAGFDASGLPNTSLWQTAAHPDAGAELLASDQGVLLVWGERVDPKLPPHQVGHSRLRLRQLSKAGQELQELELATTSLTTGTAYSVTTLAEPRALLLAWTSEEPKAGGHAQAQLARFDCVPQ